VHPVVLDNNGTQTNNARMRSWTAILLICWFMALGSGAAGYLHDLQHRWEDAATTPTGQLPPSPTPHHDDTNCWMHSQLHQPLAAEVGVVLLVCLGLFVAFLTLLTPSLVPQQAYFRIDCRGPPIS
jgi:hypothetical protein